MREEAPPAKSNSTENPAGIPTQRITPAAESPGGLGEGTTGGIPNNIASSELGPLLGRGGNKDVYVLSDTHVVGVLRSGENPAILEKEITMLRELGALGLPVLNAQGPIMVDGRPAVLYDRFVQGSKDVVKLQRNRVRIIGESSLLNEKSIADLQTIRRIMINKNIWINDLQFLIGDDGHIVISDPLDYKAGLRSPSKNNLDMIDLLIKAARNNMR
jgi:filamentous hemagglutinin